MVVNKVSDNTEIGGTIDYFEYGEALQKRFGRWEHRKSVSPMKFNNNK